MKRAAFTSVCLVFGVLTLASTSASAQSTRTQQFELWLSLPTTVDIGDDTPGLQLWLDVHVRRGPDWTTHILRPGIGFRITDWATVYAGYAWVPTFVDEPQAVLNEHRIWEQLILNFGISDARLKVQSRTRFEQRFVEGGGDVGLRLRQFARGLFHFVEGEPFGLVLWDEVFINLTDTDWGQRIGFGQNRLFFGPSVDIPKAGRLELGYMFQYVNAPVLGVDVVGHVLYMQVVLGF